MKLDENIKLSIVTIFKRTVSVNRREEAAALPQRQPNHDG